MQQPNGLAARRFYRAFYRWTILNAPPQTWHSLPSTAGGIRFNTGDVQTGKTRKPRRRERKRAEARRRGLGINRSRLEDAQEKARRALNRDLDWKHDAESVEGGAFEPFGETDEWDEEASFKFDTIPAQTTIRRVDPDSREEKPPQTFRDRLSPVIRRVDPKSVHGSGDEEPFGDFRNAAASPTVRKFQSNDLPSYMSRAWALRSKQRDKKIGKLSSPEDVGQSVERERVKERGLKIRKQPTISHHDLSDQLGRMPVRSVEQLRFEDMTPGSRVLRERSEDRIRVDCALRRPHVERLQQKYGRQLQAFVKHYKVTVNVENRRKIVPGDDGLEDVQLVVLYGNVAEDVDWVLKTIYLDEFESLGERKVESARVKPFITLKPGEGAVRFRSETDIVLEYAMNTKALMAARKIYGEDLELLPRKLGGSVQIRKGGHTARLSDFTTSGQEPTPELYSVLVSGSHAAVRKIVDALLVLVKRNVPDKFEKNSSRSLRDWVTRTQAERPSSSLPPMVFVIRHREDTYIKVEFSVIDRDWSRFVVTQDVDSIKSAFGQYDGVKLEIGTSQLRPASERSEAKENARSLVLKGYFRGVREACARLRDMLGGSTPEPPRASEGVPKVFARDVPPPKVTVAAEQRRYFSAGRTRLAAQAAVPSQDASASAATPPAHDLPQNETRFDSVSATEQPHGDAEASRLVVWLSVEPASRRDRVRTCSMLKNFLEPGTGSDIEYKHNQIAVGGSPKVIEHAKKLLEGRLKEWDENMHLVVKAVRGAQTYLRNNVEDAAEKPERTDAVGEDAEYPKTYQSSAKHSKGRDDEASGVAMTNAVLQSESPPTSRNESASGDNSGASKSPRSKKPSQEDSKESAHRSGNEQLANSGPTGCMIVQLSGVQVGTTRADELLKHITFWMNRIRRTSAIRNFFSKQNDLKASFQIRGTQSALRDVLPRIRKMVEVVSQRLGYPTPVEAKVIFDDFGGLLTEVPTNYDVPSPPNIGQDQTSVLRGDSAKDKEGTSTQEPWIYKRQYAVETGEGLKRRILRAINGSDGNGLRAMAMNAKCYSCTGVSHGVLELEGTYPALQMFDTAFKARIGLVCRNRQYPVPEIKFQELKTFTQQKEGQVSKHMAQAAEKASRTSSEVRTALRTLTHPVVVITSQASAKGKPEGAWERGARAVTVSSFNTVALQPEAVVSFNLKIPSRTWDAISSSNDLRIHFLAANPEGAAIAHTFTQPYDKPEEGFVRLDRMGAMVTYFDNVTPPQIFKRQAVLAQIRAQLLPEKCIHVGDHVIVVARVSECFYDEEAEGGGIAGLAYGKRAYRGAAEEIKPFDTTGQRKLPPAPVPAAVKDRPQFRKMMMPEKVEQPKSVKGREEVQKNQDPEQVEQQEPAYDEPLDDPIFDALRATRDAARTGKKVNAARFLEGEDEEDQSSFGTPKTNGGAPLWGPEDVIREESERLVENETPQVAHANTPSPAAESPTSPSSFSDTGKRTFSTFSRAALPGFSSKRFFSSVARRWQADDSEKGDDMNIRDQVAPSAMKMNVADFLGVPDDNKPWHGHRVRRLRTLNEAARKAENRLQKYSDQMNDELRAELEDTVLTNDREISKKLAWNAAGDLRIMLDKGRVDYQRAQWLESAIEKGQATLLEEAKVTRQLLEAGKIDREGFMKAKERLESTNAVLMTETNRLRQFVDEEGENVYGDGEGEEGGFDGFRGNR